MDVLKHRFSSEVKCCLFPYYNRHVNIQAMVGINKIEVAKRLRQAMDEEKVTNTDLADATDVTIQAVTGWLKNGKISATNLPGICRKINRSIEWLLTGLEPTAHYSTKTIAHVVHTMETMDIEDQYLAARLVDQVSKPQDDKKANRQ